MKRIKLLTMVLALAIGSTVYGEEIKVVVNTEQIEMPIAPIQFEGMTFVPLRIVAETLQTKVDYLQDTQEVVLTKDGKMIKLVVGSKKLMVEDKEVMLDVAPTIKEGHTMVPVRVISEVFGAEVGWDSKNNQVLIKTEVQQQLPIVSIKIKDKGTITAELYPHIAPNTVNNFIHLAESGFYDGLTFHRVIEDFMIQGGCPQGSGMGNPGYSIAGEFAMNGYEGNTLKHTEGVLSMARSRHNDTAGSQFFIMTSKSPHLDGEYAAFGKVTGGMEIVEAIEAVKVAGNDMPLEPIIIETITVETHDVEYSKPIIIK